MNTNISQILSQKCSEWVGSFREGWIVAVGQEEKPKNKKSTSASYSKKEQPSIISTQLASSGQVPNQPSTSVPSKYPTIASKGSPPKGYGANPSRNKYEILSHGVSGPTS